MALLNKGKNYIINGAMDFWQRGTSFAAATSGTYAADRFLVTKNGTMVHTISKDTDVPTLAQSGFNFAASYKLTLTTAQASLSAGQWAGFSHRIEGQVFAPLAGRTMTLSFWVKAALIGTYSVAFVNGNQTRSYVKTYTINAANTWEKKTVTLTHDASGTWDYTTGLGISVMFMIASTQQSLTEGAWVDGLFLGFGTQTNGVQSTATSFNFTGIMLEEGEQPSQFERAGGDISRELLSCQRYYCKSYILGTAPGTNTGNGTTAGRFIGALAVSASLCGAASFPTNMRISPTVSIFATDGVAGSWSLNTTRAYRRNRWYKRVWIFCLWWLQCKYRQWILDTLGCRRRTLIGKTHG
jgi:hypothetical protein